MAKKIEKPAYGDNFKDGYTHALKDAYDVLAMDGNHVGSYVVGEMHRNTDKISKDVQRSLARWKNSLAKAGTKKRRG